MLKLFSGVSMGIVTLVSSIALLNSCSGRVVAVNAVDVTKIGRLQTTERLVFSSCAVRVDRYAGGTGVSLEGCNKEASAVIIEDGKSRVIRANDVYIFGKSNNGVELSLYASKNIIIEQFPLS